MSCTTSISNIRQQVEAVYKLADDTLKRLEQNPSVFRLKKTKKEISEMKAQLKRNWAKASDEAHLQPMSDEMVKMGNRLLAIGREAKRGSSRGEEDEEQVIELPLPIAPTAKLVSLATRVKVTKKHRFDGLNKCHACKTDCQLKEKVAQCLACNQLAHPKCLDLQEKEVSCPRCGQKLANDAYKRQ